MEENKVVGKRLDQRTPLSEFPELQNRLLLDAAYGEKKLKRAPVWMMRQAGRYLPEYMEISRRSDFFSMCRDPEVASTISLQPLERFKTLDAVIVFSDILVIPQAMGMEVQMIPGKGPVFPDPLQTPDDFSRLVMSPDIENQLGYIFDAVNLCRKKINGRVPLIGFSGAPLTLMTYMVEGGGSKTHSSIKSFIYNYPEASHTLLASITDIIIKYLVGKVQAGAQLVQVFESNAGSFTPALFKEYSLPYLKKIATEVKKAVEVPMTVFALGAHSEGVLEELDRSDYDVVGLHWSMSPAEGRRRVPTKAVQGNLDPCILLASKQTIRSHVRQMLTELDVASNHRYIANLGHGMMPIHNPEHAHEFILAVQEISAELRSVGEDV